MTINSYTEKELRDLFVHLAKNCFPLPRQYTFSITLLLFFLDTEKMGNVSFTLSMTSSPIIWYKPLLKKYRLLSSEELYQKMSCPIAKEFYEKSDELVQRFMKVLFLVPLDELPLYINETQEIKIAVTWRLNRGK